MVVTRMLVVHFVFSFEKCGALSLLSHNHVYATMWHNHRQQKGEIDLCRHHCDGTMKYFLHWVVTPGMLIITNQWYTLSGRTGSALAVFRRSHVRGSLSAASLVICSPARIAVCNTWSSGGTALCRVGGVTSQLDLPSLTPVSVAGCGWLQLGAPHWATSVNYCK